MFKNGCADCKEEEEEEMGGRGEGGGDCATVAVHHQEVRLQPRHHSLQPGKG